MTHQITTCDNQHQMLESLKEDSTRLSSIRQQFNINSNADSERAATGSNDDDGYDDGDDDADDVTIYQTAIEFARTHGGVGCVEFEEEPREVEEDNTDIINTISESSTSCLAAAAAAADGGVGGPPAASSSTKTANPTCPAVTTSSTSKTMTSKTSISSGSRQKLFSKRHNKPGVRPNATASRMCLSARESRSLMSRASHALGSGEQLQPVSAHRYHTYTTSRTPCRKTTCSSYSCTAATCDTRKTNLPAKDLADVTKLLESWDTEEVPSAKVTGSSSSSRRRKSKKSNQNTAETELSVGIEDSDTIGDKGVSKDEEEIFSSASFDKFKEFLTSKYEQISQQHDLIKEKAKEGVGGDNKDGILDNNASNTNSHDGCLKSTVNNSFRFGITPNSAQTESKFALKEPIADRSSSSAQSVIDKQSAIKSTEGSKHEFRYLEKVQIEMVTITDVEHPEESDSESESLLPEKASAKSKSPYRQKRSTHTSCSRASTAISSSLSHNKETPTSSKESTFKQGDMCNGGLDVDISKELALKCKISETDHQQRTQITDNKHKDNDVVNTNIDVTANNNNNNYNNNNTGDTSDGNKSGSNNSSLPTLGQPSRTHRMRRRHHQPGLSRDNKSRNLPSNKSERCSEKLPKLPPITNQQHGQKKPRESSAETVPKRQADADSVIQQPGTANKTMISSGVISSKRISKRSAMHKNHRKDSSDETVRAGGSSLPLSVNLTPCVNMFRNVTSVNKSYVISSPKLTGDKNAHEHVHKNETGKNDHRKPLHNRIELNDNSHIDEVQSSVDRPNSDVQSNLKQASFSKQSPREAAADSMNRSSSYIPDMPAPTRSAVSPIFSFKSKSLREELRQKLQVGSTSSSRAPSENKCNVPTRSCSIRPRMSSNYLSSDHGTGEDINNSNCYSSARNTRRGSINSNLNEFDQKMEVAQVRMGDDCKSIRQCNYNCNARYGLPDSSSSDDEHSERGDGHDGSRALNKFQNDCKAKLAIKIPRCSNSECMSLDNEDSRENESDKSCGCSMMVGSQDNDTDALVDSLTVRGSRELLHPCQRLVPYSPTTENYWDTSANCKLKLCVPKDISMEANIDPINQDCCASQTKVISIPKNTGYKQLGQFRSLVEKRDIDAYYEFQSQVDEGKCDLAEDGCCDSSSITSCEEENSNTTKHSRSCKVRASFGNTCKCHLLSSSSHDQLPSAVQEAIRMTSVASNNTQKYHKSLKTTEGEHKGYVDTLENPLKHIFEASSQTGGLQDTNQSHARQEETNSTGGHNRIKKGYSNCRISKTITSAFVGNRVANNKQTEDQDSLSPCPDSMPAPTADQLQNSGAVLEDCTNQKVIKNKDKTLEERLTKDVSCQIDDNASADQIHKRPVIINGILQWRPKKSSETGAELIAPNGQVSSSRCTSTTNNYFACHRRIGRGLKLGTSNVSIRFLDHNNSKRSVNVDQLEGCSWWYDENESGHFSKKSSSCLEMADSVFSVTYPDYSLPTLRLRAPASTLPVSSVCNRTSTNTSSTQVLNSVDEVPLDLLENVSGPTTRVISEVGNDKNRLLKTRYFFDKYDKTTLKDWNHYNQGRGDDNGADDARYKLTKKGRKQYGTNQSVSLYKLTDEGKRAFSSILVEQSNRKRKGRYSPPSEDTTQRPFKALNQLV